MNEWTGEQQLYLLLESVWLGVWVGAAFDLITGIGRSMHRRHVTFALDVFFWIVAALITFFGSLVITDGRLHPLLFAGVLMGATAEHFLIGRIIGKWLCFLVTLFRRCSMAVSRQWGRMIRRVSAFVASLVRFAAKGAKESEKSRKKLNFFRKKT